LYLSDELLLQSANVGATLLLNSALNQSAFHMTDYGAHLFSSLIAQISSNSANNNVSFFIGLEIIFQLSTFMTQAYSEQPSTSSTIQPSEPNREVCELIKVTVKIELLS
jgi:hypothetical protein